MKKTILIMAAGTGGHVFPALAVAKAFEKAGHRVAWLGTRNGIEYEKIRAEGIPFYELSIMGLRGKNVQTLLKAPFAIAQAVWQARAVIKKEKPDLVLGFGGYVTGPGGVAAFLSGVPLVIHEQNAILGLSNRLLSKVAKACLEAFPGTFPAQKQALLTGNPIREAFLNIPPPNERFQGRQGPVRLLVLGGSLGAKLLNETVPAALLALPPEWQPEVRHQAGPKLFEMAQNAYVGYPCASVTPFIDNMAEAYAWADLVICRAGALTVSEVAAAGVPAIFVPYLHAVDDHQTANAQSLVKQNAAFLLPQLECTALRLGEMLKGLMQDLTGRLNTAQNARNLAVLDATHRVQNKVISILEAKS